MYHVFCLEWPPFLAVLAPSSENKKFQEVWVAHNALSLWAMKKEKSPPLSREGVWKFIFFLLLVWVNPPSTYTVLYLKLCIYGFSSSSVIAVSATSIAPQGRLGKQDKNHFWNCFCVQILCLSSQKYLLKTNFKIHSPGPLIRHAPNNSK